MTGQTYHSENTSQWNREIADEIKIRMKGLGMDRYKFVVQVVIGEQRGEGVRFGPKNNLTIRMACRCFWDSDADGYSTASFTNVLFFVL